MQPDAFPVDPQHEELVAYLDGELPAADRSRLEQRLAADATLRADLQALARTWEGLDHLPRAHVGEEFTQTTVSLIALAAQEDLAATQAVVQRRQRRWGAGTAVACVAAAVLGFAVGGYLWPDPNPALLRDLPVLERLDQYRQVPDIEFLRRLLDQGDFTTEADDAV